MNSFVLVTGDREWSNYLRIRDVLAFTQPRKVITGGARGADKLAELACNELGIECIVIPADWATHGKAAGPIRNRKMLDHGPDLVIAFHDDLESSKGTLNCVNQARNRSIPVARYDSQSGTEAIEV